MALEFGAFSLQNCKDVLGFGHVGAVAEDHWVAVVEEAVSSTGGEAEVGESKDMLEKRGNDELGEIHFGFVRDV